MGDYFMKIERNVSMPAAPAKAPVRHVPVESMEIGDRIYFAGATRNSALGSVPIVTIKAGLRQNYKTAKEGNGARVWRIA